MTIFVSSLIGRLRAALRRGRFGRDERGSTLIEFALLAVPFFAIVGAILETALVFLASQVLDSAVTDASRLIRTGQAQNAGYTTTNFKTVICGRLYGLFGDCSGLRVKVTEIDDFASATVEPPLPPTCDPTCDWTVQELFETGGGSSIIMVEAYYKWPIILSYLGLATQPDGTRLLATVRVFGNEPFS